MTPEGEYSGLDGERLRWVEAAVEATSAWIEKARGDSAVERLFSAPGDWDYDYATDLGLEAHKAEQTLQMLEAERAHLMARQEHIRRDSEAGKYRDGS